jgi:hypothetical protein
LLTIQIQAITALGPGVEGEELVGGLVVGDELGGGGNGGGAIGRGDGVAAVVEDDVGGQTAAVEAVDFVLQAEGDGDGGGIFPVGGHGVPEDGCEAETAGDAQGCGTAGAEGRTEEADGRAGDFGESFVGAVKLLFDCGGGGQGQVEMGPGVVADAVAGGDDLADERGFGLGAAADEKEGGAHAAASKNIEQAGGPDGVGAVVEGEGEFAGMRRSEKRGPEELRGGPEGGISETARCQAESGCGSESGGDSYGQGGDHSVIQFGAPGAGRASSEYVPVW